MAIAFRAVGTGGNGTNGPASVTPTKPAGTASTDVLVAILGFGGGTAVVVTPPSGWTLVKRTDNGTTNGAAAYWALGSVASLAFGLSGVIDAVSAIVAGYTGVDNATPMDATAVGQTNTASATVTAPSITTVTANAQIVFLGAPYDAARGTPGTWTTVFGTVRGNTGIRGAAVDSSEVVIADAAQAATGASGTKTETYSLSLPSVGILAALRPGASAAVDPGPPPRRGPMRRPGGPANALTRFRSPGAFPPPAFNPATSSWSATLPERQARPAWNPERSHLVAGPVIIPRWGAGPVLPEFYGRPAWRPERTETFWPPFQFAAVTVPTWGYEVLGAQRLAPWNPERTETAWNPIQFAAPTVPTWGYEVLGARLPVPWSPDRGQSLWNPIQFVATPAPTWGYEVLGAGPRAPWIPDRGQALWNPIQIAAAVVPTWGYEVLGSQTNLRAPWNPERSHTVAQPYIFPRPGATVVLPERFAFPRWNPERSATLSVPFIIPPRGYTVTLPEAYARPPWRPERSETAFPVRIAPAPPLSWRPELLERYIARWRAPPNLDLWLPPFPPATVVVVPAVVLFLLGRQDAYALLGRQDLIALLGRQDLIIGVGRSDSYLILGRQDAYSIPGGNMPLSAILKIPLGDDVTIAMTLQDSTGAAFNLTGCTIVVGIKKYLTDAAALISKTIANGGIVVTNAAGGLANLLLNATDTASLGAGDYPFDVQVTNGSGKKATLLAGTITLTDHPTR